MKTGTGWAALAALGLALGCGSSSTGTGADAAPVADAASSGADLSTAPPDTGMTAADSAAGSADGPTADGPAGDGPAVMDTSAPSDVQASPACVMFCTCMAKNCADKAFPGGCLQDCASHPKWDLECRALMCKLAPDQPNNNHCTHAMGINECLDKP
jgi:hypothetical protein